MQIIFYTNVGVNFTKTVRQNCVLRLVIYYSFWHNLCTDKQTFSQNFSYLGAICISNVFYIKNARNHVTLCTIATLGDVTQIILLMSHNQCGKKQEMVTSLWHKITDILPTNITKENSILCQFRHKLYQFWHKYNANFGTKQCQFWHKNNANFGIKIMPILAQK
jgi:hypothetical protein